jgi:hypothetical protein
MPKSFKICPVRRFNASAFDERTFLDQQQPLPGMTNDVATTSIRKSAGGGSGFEDFRQYVIEHDRIVRMPGRYGDVKFPEFTYTGTISGFHSEQRSLLLLSGKKADVLSFCAETTNVTDLQIDTLHIDMNALQALLPSVNLVWFKFKKGMIRASALMGAYVERTAAFVQSKSEGEISTLSFYFEDSMGDKHPMMIVEDGTVVLQAQYQEIAFELSLVISAQERLLKGISQAVSPRISGKTFSISQTAP